MITIVIGYTDRKQQFIKTLKSFSESDFKDFEVVTVFDEGDTSCNDLLKEFPFKMRYVWIPAVLKSASPVLVYNAGFHVSRGDIVVMQSAECLHLFDVLSHISKNFDPASFYSYGCYAIDRITTDRLDGFVFSTERCRGVILPTNDNGTGHCDRTGWYNHSVFRPCGYPFLGVIAKSVLAEIGGCDLRFLKGTWYEDNDFLARLGRRGVGVKIVDHPFCVHQFHNVVAARNRSLVKNNAALFNLTSKETGWIANGGKFLGELEFEMNILEN